MFLRPLLGQRIIITSEACHNTSAQPLYTDSIIIYWLGLHGLRLCRHGSTLPDTSLAIPLSQLPLPGDLIQHCDRNNIKIIGELITCTKQGTYIWYDGAPYDRLLPLLPDKPPTEPNPLQIGQFWKLQNHASAELRAGHIVRIEGQAGSNIIVTHWKISDKTKPRRATASHTSHNVPYNLLFPNKVAIKVNALKLRGTAYTICDDRTQPRPTWPEEL